MSSSIIVSIIADPIQIVYGDSLPELSYYITFSDNNNTHGSDIIIGSNPISLEYSSIYNVGTYNINLNSTEFTILSGATNNYTFQFTNSILTVNKASLTVTADNQSMTYNGLTYSGSKTVQYAGFVNGENQTELGGTLVYGGTSSSGINYGTYTIIPSGLTSTNYNISYVNGTLTVNKASLTVTANNQSMTYNGLTYSGSKTVQYAGFVNGENQTELGGTLVYGGTSSSGINYGTYTIIPSGLTSTNYNISYVNGTLTVNKASLTVTANNQSMTYNGLTYSGSKTVQYAGFVNGENQSVLTGTLIYSGTSSSGINYGTYTIIPSGLTSTNYNISYVNGTLTIYKATLTVSKVSGVVSFVYGSTINYSQFYQIIGFVNGETSLVVTGTPTIFVNGVLGASTYNAGTYSNITINDIGTLNSLNYSFTVNNTNSCSLVINKVPLVVSKVSGSFSFVYGSTINYSQFYQITGFVNGETSSVVTGTPTIFVNGSIALPIYSSGTYSNITINDIGTLNSLNYSFTVNNTNSCSLVINKVPLVVSKVSGSFSFVYGSTINYSQFYQITGFVNGETSSVVTGTPTIFVNGVLGTSIYNVGTYSNITINDVGTLNSLNYLFSISNTNNCSFIITKAQLTISPKTPPTVYYYGNNRITYTDLYTISGYVNGESSLVNMNNGPTYRPTILFISSTQVSTQYLYNISTFDIGTYQIQIQDKGGLVEPSNYSFVISNPQTLPTLTINKAIMNIFIDGSYYPYYGDSNIQNSLFTNSLAFTGFAYGQNPTSISTGTIIFKITSNDNLISSTTIPGIYNITVDVSDYINHASNNYFYRFNFSSNLQATYDLTIQPAKLTVTANNASQLYTGSIYPNPYSVQYSGFVNSDNQSIIDSSGLTFGGTSSSAINCGTYTIVPSGIIVNSNYTINYVSGTLTINKVQLTVSPVSPSTSYNYGNNTISYTDLYTLTGFVNNENSSVIPLNNSTNRPTISFISSTLVESVYTYNSSKFNVGTYSIKVNSIGTLSSTNYSFVVSNPGTLPTLTINKVPITITVNSSYIPLYGDTNIQTTLFNNALTFSGIQYSQTPSTISSGSITFNLTSNGNLVDSTLLPGGPYGITINTTNYINNLTNYTCTISTSTYDLTIQKAILTVTANNVSSIYTSAVYSGSYSVSYSGFVNSQNQLSLTGTLSYSGTCTTGIQVGTYTIIPSGLISSTYTFNYVQGTLTINKAPLVVTAVNKSMNYTSSIYSSSSYTVSYSGFVGIENESILGGTLIYSGTCTTGINVGSYTIVPSGLNSSNYNITYVDGTLTISTAPLTVTANNQSMTYNGLTYSGSKTVQYAGFVGSENQSVLTGTLVYSGTYLSGINVGTYTIIPSGLTSTNYNIIYVNGTLTINKATLTVGKVSGSFSFVYGSTINYSQFYQITGFVNGETVIVVSGTPIIFVNGILSASIYNVGTYSNITINDIGSLSASNYSFSINNTNSNSLVITKATLTISPKTPPTVYIYGNNKINYTDLYTISGFVNNEYVTTGNLYRPTILINSIQYTYNDYVQFTQFNVGTYPISIQDYNNLNSSNLFVYYSPSNSTLNVPLSTNYSFVISNPSTLPRITINKLNITIDLYSSSFYQPYYGDSNIQTSLFNNALGFTNPAYSQSVASTSTGTINFKLTSNSNPITSSTLPGTYNVTVDISNFSSNSTNYTYSILQSPPTYNLTIQKARLTVSPISGSTYIKNYGDTFTTSELNSLYQITGFVGSDLSNQSTILTGTPTIRISDRGTGVSYPCNSTSITPYSNNNYTLYVDTVGTLQVNPTSNYNTTILINNSIQRIVQINKITLESKSLVFYWNKYVPPIAYGTPLTNYQLNATSPLNPYTNNPIGIISYIGRNSVTSVQDSTNFTIGGLPNIGTYILTSYLTVTDTNFIVPSSIPYIINSSYPITVLGNYSLISHFNPLPISRNSTLTSVQLSATCNSTNNPSDISYVDDNGNQLTVGSVVSNSTGVTEILTNYSNSNYYPKYTFRKIKLDVV